MMSWGTPVFTYSLYKLQGLNDELGINRIYIQFLGVTMCCRITECGLMNRIKMLIIKCCLPFFYLFSNSLSFYVNKYIVCLFTVVMSICVLLIDAICLYKKKLFD